MRSTDLVLLVAVAVTLQQLGSAELGLLEKPVSVWWKGLHSIHLSAFHFTTGVRPLPQLLCSSNCQSASVTSVTCTVASDNENRNHFPPLDWRCSSDEPLENVRLLAERVSCECSEYCSEERIIQDSCSLTYSLARTDGKEGSDISAGQAVAGIAILILILYYLSWKRGPSQQTRVNRQAGLVVPVDQASEESRTQELDAEALPDKQSPPEESDPSSVRVNIYTEYPNSLDEIRLTNDPVHVRRWCFN